jgi:hypothetical protein
MMKIEKMKSVMKMNQIGRRKNENENEIDDEDEPDRWWHAKKKMNSTRRSHFSLEG